MTFGDRRVARVVDQAPLAGPVGLAVVAQLGFVVLDHEARGVQVTGWGLTGLSTWSSDAPPWVRTVEGGLGARQRTARAEHSVGALGERRARALLAALDLGDVGRPVVDSSGQGGLGEPTHVPPALQLGHERFGRRVLDLVGLTLGLYAQAVVSLGAATAESMAARFQLPGSDKPRDGRAMESTDEGSEGQGGEDATP